MVSIYSNLLCNHKFLKKYSDFHWCILRGFDYKETVCELFDNPSYVVEKYILIDKQIIGQRVAVLVCAYERKYKIFLFVFTVYCI